MCDVFTLYFVKSSNFFAVYAFFKINILIVICLFAVQFSSTSCQSFYKVVSRSGIILPSLVLIVTGICQSCIYPTLQPHMGAVSTPLIWKIVAIGYKTFFISSIPKLIVDPKLLVC